MEYLIAGKKHSKQLVQIRLEMLKKVNSLDENYQFSEDFVKEVKKYFAKGDQVNILALDDGKAVGCATLSFVYIMPTFSHPTGNRAHLMNVYTNEGYRRQGIARHMVQMLIDIAANRGVTEITLDATESGRPLYQAMGFESSASCMTMNLSPNQ